ncbi:TPA: hypothetical protein N0F65_008378 [Lagenidium giganteum]|uniref:phosphatidylinositol-3,5-bisphosphate 3-phosphatase n=1 Tax=Lagenidium giganteum TaxID=4803 RepID=A0AAV2Z0D5_9STRA|nr:TPA: hypothetical protein N0F65_008378 [Lagenidium giganteum]
MLLKIIRAEDLPASDPNGKSDPFVKVLYDGREVGVTPRVKKNLNPRWDAEVAFPLVHASWMYVVLEVWDRDELSANDLLGSLRVPFPEWRPLVEEYTKRQHIERQRVLAHQKSMQLRQHQAPMNAIAEGEVMSKVIKTKDLHRRSQSLNSCALVQRVQEETAGRASSAVAPLSPVNISSPPSNHRPQQPLMDPIKPVLIWSTLVKGSIAQGRILCSIQYEERDLQYFVNLPYGTNVQEVFLPQNPRFQPVYCHLPRSWHPDHNIRQQELSALSAGTPKDCLFPWHEKLLHTVEEVTVTFHVNESNQGVLATMVLTNYRVWFVPYRRVKGLVHEDVHTISVAKILKASISQKKRSNNNVITVLELENMDAGHYHVTLSPISRLRDSVRDFSREAEAKRIKQLYSIVAEIEWLQLENSFCAPRDLNHTILTGEDEELEEQMRNYTPKLGEQPPVKPVGITRATTSANTTESQYDTTPLLQRATTVHRKPPNTNPVGSPPARITQSQATRRRIRYDAAAEYRRQGVFEHPRWRPCSLNENYELCSTYPNLLIVPSVLRNDIVKEASRFRSKNRLPVLTWIHPRTGAPLCRSSQPNTGVLRTTNSYDKELIWAVRDAAIPADVARSSPQALPKKNSVLNIVDARPEINAKSNAFAGKGHESVKQYDRDNVTMASITFMGIDNIHVVRNSFIGLAQALYEVDDSNFFGAVQKSRWLEHVCNILQGASEVATHLERGEAVLVHCSDGWDRTAQLSSLAQLMLDPYFRTLEGFAILIEKDWCSFGHMFKKRCGHPTSDNTSPIFQQFLDAVYQLTLQFPTHFQFNELYLSSVAEAVYSSWYGTFQTNSEKERREFLRDVPTVSVWDVIRASTDQFLNPLFIGMDGNGENSRLESMLPMCRVRLMQLWCSQYQKAISHMRLQQRESEMLLLIRQQESQLSKISAILTSEQRLQLRAMQLRSDISSLARSMNLDYPDESERREKQKPRGHDAIPHSVAGPVHVGGKRTTASSVDFHDLTSMVNASDPQSPSSSQNGLHLEQSSASTSSAHSASGSHNNVPNPRRRKSVSRSRSNSLRFKNNIMNMMNQMTGQEKPPPDDQVEDAAPPPPAITVRPHVLSPRSEQNQAHEEMKAEVQHLESQLGKLNSQIGKKEDAAKLLMRKFRCYNYNITETQLSESDEMSPAHNRSHRTSRFRHSARELNSPGGVMSPSSSSSPGSSPTSRNRTSNGQGDVNFTPGSAPLLTTNKIISSGNFRNAQPVWERDADAPCCKRCKKKFKTFYRNRHHCRCCGYVFCGRCTSNRMNLPEFGYYDVVRVCVLCYNSGEDV